jgi:uncharacterized protein YaaW (UPF0174 family)
LFTADNDINEIWHKYYEELQNEEYPIEQLIPLQLIKGPIHEITEEEVLLAVSKIKNVA